MGAGTAVRKGLSSFGQGPVPGDCSSVKEVAKDSGARTGVLRSQLVYQRIPGALRGQAGEIRRPEGHEQNVAGT